MQIVSASPRQYGIFRNHDQQRRARDRDQHQAAIRNGQFRKHERAQFQSPRRAQVQSPLEDKFKAAEGQSGTGQLDPTPLFLLAPFLLSRRQNPQSRR